MNIANLFIDGNTANYPSVFSLNPPILKLILKLVAHLSTKYKLYDFSRNGNLAI